MQIDTFSLLLGAATYGLLFLIVTAMRNKNRIRKSAPWLKPRKQKSVEMISLPIGVPSIKVQPRYGQLKRTAAHPGDINFNFNESHK